MYVYYNKSFDATKLSGKMKVQCSFKHYYVKELFEIVATVLHQVHGRSYGTGKDI
jgi:hypothetical protein